jgi:hypothetical protein
MERYNALTFIRYPEEMPTAWVNSFSPWGVEYTLGKETSGHPNCKKGGESQMVVFIESPNVACYQKLFSDRPKPMAIEFTANVSAWYDNGSEEIHIDLSNWEEYRDLVDDWYMTRKGTYDPEI